MLAQDERLVAQMRRYAKRRFGETWARVADDFADAAESLLFPGPLYRFEVKGSPIVSWFLEERAVQPRETSTAMCNFRVRID